MHLDVEHAPNEMTVISHSVKNINERILTSLKFIFAKGTDSVSDDVGLTTCMFTVGLMTANPMALKVLFLTPVTNPH